MPAVTALAQHFMTRPCALVELAAPKISENSDTNQPEAKQKDSGKTQQKAEGTSP